MKINQPECLWIQAWRVKWWFHGERTLMVTMGFEWCRFLSTLGRRGISTQTELFSMILLPWYVEFSGSPSATSNSNSTPAAKPSMHILEETSWSEPTWCKHCGGFLWGVYRQADKQAGLVEWDLVRYSSHITHMIVCYIWLHLIHVYITYMYDYVRTYNT